MLTSVINNILCAATTAVPKCKHLVTLLHQEFIAAYWCTLPVSFIVRLDDEQVNTVGGSIVRSKGIHTACATGQDLRWFGLNVLTNVKLTNVATTYDSKFHKMLKNNRCLTQQSSG